MRFFIGILAIVVLASCARHAETDAQVQSQNSGIPKAKQARDEVLTYICTVFAKQYHVELSRLSPDLGCRQIGAGSQYHDELNYVEVLLAVEGRFGISLDDSTVLKKEKVGFEMIPEDMTPRKLSGIVNSRIKAQKRP